LDTEGLRRFASQYIPLVIAAVFMQLAIPISTIMASRLPPGSVAALGLGGKVISFVTGLIGAGLASVLLPYFSEFVAKNRLADARGELAFMLSAGTLITIPISIILGSLSAPFVHLAFEGGVLGVADGELVARVVGYGILQLPFFVTNILLLRFATAAGYPRRVLVGTCVGVVTLITINLVLMRWLGAPGLALSMTISSAIAAVVMLAIFVWSDDVGILDAAFIMTNWFLYLAIAVCIHFRSLVGEIGAIVAFCLLALGGFSASFRSRDPATST
jgi:putative peptidoglycan lipid II flippase